MGDLSIYDFSKGFTWTAEVRADDVSADEPYGGSWLSDEKNLKKWDTIIVTVDSDNKMVTYVNGIEIQRYTDACFRISQQG